MVARSGDALVDASARRAYVELLFPLAAVITPNLLEAEALLGHPVRDVAAMREAARALRALGPAAVLVKGGGLTRERRGGGRPLRRAGDAGTLRPPDRHAPHPRHRAARSRPPSPRAWPGASPSARPCGAPRTTSPRGCAGRMRSAQGRGCVGHHLVVAPGPAIR